jgi:large subunit ribosomal protein L6
MSRVAKAPISIPQGVQISIAGRRVVVKNGAVELSISLHSLVVVAQEGDSLCVKPLDDGREANAQAGTARAILANMVHGVTKGFEKRLTLVGVGYKVALQGDVLNLALGFSHPVLHKLPAGVKAEVPSQTEVVIKGADKQSVGETAAKIRAYRPPEPYKGKGVRYANEHVVIKETKKK